MRNLDACRNVPALADLIWAERALVERLHYRLVVAQLVLAADQRPLVSQALAEIEDAMGALSAAEQQRADAVALVARDWELPVEEVTLSRLSAECPEPWASMFDEHRTAFESLTEQIAAVSGDGLRLATTALTTIRASLGVLAGPPAAAYTERGIAAVGPVAPTRVDRAL